jgi:MFS family permease
MSATGFVLLLGVVSLLADMTYEGARSATGQFLAVLGASGAAVGIVAGLGELVGYALRLVFGYISDRTRKYWTITLAGYAMNLIAVPLLALAGRWEVAAALMIAERLGKAVRTPARDAMLSHATKSMGRGWGFGIHEALDQVGAVLGPLVVAAVLYRQGGYRWAFTVLLIPALGALGTLLVARHLYPSPSSLEAQSATVDSRGLPRAFWIYLGAVALIAAGYADFPLIAYHLKRTAVAGEVLVPVFYAVAMGVDAVAALVFGRLFDRMGIAVLVLAAAVSSVFAPLVFLGGGTLPLVGLVLWGVGMGAHESILRAAVAQMAPAGRRGSAYGVFNAAYGVAWFAGSATLGALYDVSLPAVAAVSASLQVLAIPVILVAARAHTCTAR